jgi:hypothetical protein
MVVWKKLTATLLILCGAAAASAELVGVDGSGTQYATPIPAKVAGKDVTLRLTGTALRKKFLFHVYTIGSYVQDGVAVASAEELVAADCPKRLHLVMEREVSGKDLAEAFRAAIRANYPAPAYEAELNRLAELMQPLTAVKGDHIWLTHVPGVGLHCLVVGKTEINIPGVPFTRAVWEIYLGKNNLGDEIKKGLTSRL